MEALRLENRWRAVEAQIQSELQHFVLNAGRDKDGNLTFLDDYVANIGLCEALNELAAAWAAARCNGQVHWTPSSTWMLVRTVLERVDFDAIEGAPHLLAAKVLLGVGVDDNGDVLVPGRNGMTLSQLRASDHRLSNLRLEKHLDLRKAFVVKLFPRLSEYTALRPNRPAAVQIGTQLAQAIANELGNGDLSAYGASSALDPPVITDQRANLNDLSDSVRAAMVAAAQQVDRPTSRGYPDAIRPTKLAVSMTLSPVDRAGPGDSWEEAEIRLYSGRDSSGGIEALAALSKNRVMVLGDPGSGKTTILAAGFANHIEAGGTGIFVRMSDVGRLAEANPPKSAAEAARILIDAFELWLDVRISGVVQSALQAKVLEDSDVFAALDGLDEVHSASSRLASFQTIKLLNDVRGRIAITSRHTGYTSPSPDFYEVEVDRLTWDQVVPHKVV